MNSKIAGGSTPEDCKEICSLHNVIKEKQICFTCEGDGELECDDDFGGGWYMEVCYSCNGKGYLSGVYYCEDCEQEYLDEENESS